MTTTLRPVRDNDEEFLIALYGSTRAEELSRVPWTDEQKDAFVRMQFAAQTTYYRQVYPDMEYNVIVHDGVDAGRLIVVELEHEFRIVDVCLLPGHRNAGMGTYYIEKVFARARAAGKAVGISVEVFNPARKLYERLGFREKSPGDVYIQMEWLPGKDAV